MTPLEMIRLYRKVGRKGVKALRRRSKLWFVRLRYFDTVLTGIACRCPEVDSGTTGRLLAGR